MQEKNQETVFGLDFACLQIKEFSFNKAESKEINQQHLSSLSNNNNIIENTDIQPENSRLSRLVHREKMSNQLSLDELQKVFS